MTKSPDTQLTAETAVVAVAALLAQEREDRIAAGDDIPRTELVLHGAGLGGPEIASLLRKKPDTVRKTLLRTK